jgi:hypothetical protein
MIEQQNIKNKLNKEKADHDLNKKFPNSTLDFTK